MSTAATPTRTSRRARSPCRSSCSRASASLAGLANATAFGIEEFAKYVEPTGRLPARCIVPDFDVTLAAVSFFLVVISLGVASVFWLDRKELQALKGLTERSSAAKAGHRFLLNKYYLDHLYEGTIVAGIKGPIARAAYWVNQHVIDGVVNARGQGRRPRSAGSSTATSTRTVVDGAVNGIANETGERRRPAAATSRPGACSGTRSSSSASVGVLALLLVIFS